MSEMIERVAEAIWNAESIRAGSRPRSVAWAEVGDNIRGKYIPLARAAIEAMREPSHEMMRAMFEAMFEAKFDGTDAPMMGAGFEAAIDAALKEQTK